MRQEIFETIEIQKTAKIYFYTQAENIRRKVEKETETDEVGLLIVKICEQVALSLTQEIAITQDQAFSVFGLITDFAVAYNGKTHNGDKGVQLEIVNLVPTIVAIIQNYAILEQLKQLKNK